MKKALQMAMAVLLLVGMLGTQVFADTGVTPSSQPTTATSTFTFKSELSVPADTLVPNVTVSYSIVGEAADGSGRIAGPKSTTGGSCVTVGSASFSNTDYILLHYMCDILLLLLHQNTLCFPCHYVCQ